MHLLKKYRWDILLVFILFFGYLFTRCVALTSVPIFTDEAIYLRWAQIGGNDASWRFISLTDGKQPLFIWLVMGSMRFILDPLIAGRLVSVGAGVLSMIGLFLISRELFRNKWIGYISSFLYILFPFALVYDRLALYDSLVGTFALWGLYVAILFVRYARLDIALIFGFVTGAAVLNKTSGFFTLGLFPFSFLLFDWRERARAGRLVKLFGLFFLVIMLTFGFYSILRLSPFYYLIAQKNALFVYPLKEWLHHPFTFFLGNLRGVFDWLTRYLSYPLLLLVFLSFFITTDKAKLYASFRSFFSVLFIGGIVLLLLSVFGNKDSIPVTLPFIAFALFLVSMFLGYAKKIAFFKEKLLLIFWFMTPFVYLAFFGNAIYPRYIFFMTLSLLPLISYGLWHVMKLGKHKMVGFIIVVLFILYPLYTHFLILTNFPAAPIPKSDITQLYTDWPSGAGVKESIIFFKEQQKIHGEIVIATAGTFGLMPYAYELYFWNDPRVHVRGYWPIDSAPAGDLLAWGKKIPTYIVFYQKCIACANQGTGPVAWPMTQVFQYKKIVPDTYLTVYQIHNK